MTVKSYEKGSKHNTQKSLQSEISSNGFKICIKSNENLYRNLIYIESKQNPLISPYISKKKNKVSSRNTKPNKNFIKVGDSEYILPMKINKANSDDYKNTKQMPRKTKKSVLTLPNKQLPLPQTCTVSDMNDSEYFQEPNYDKETKPLKKQQLKNKRKSRSTRKNVEDDELNHRLDCSLSSLDKHFYGDGVRKAKNKKTIKNKTVESNVRDVWSIVKNLHKFQVFSSPPMSQNSDSSLETYKNIESFIHNPQGEGLGGFYNDNVDNYSQTSFDRITVIEQNDCYKNSQHRDAIKSHPIKKHNNSVTNEPQRCLNVNAKSNKMYSEKKSKYNDIKLWIKKINSINSNHLTLHYKTNKEFKQYSQDTNGLNLKDEDGEHATNLKDVRTGSGKTQVTKSNSNELRSGSVRNLQQSKEGINGITKVVLNKQKRTEMSNTKALKAAKTIVYCDVPKPKYTQAEVERRLARMKFPIVILEKDQLSSSVQVINNEASQFSGVGPMDIFKKDKFQGNYENELTIKKIKGKYVDKKIETDDDTGVFNMHSGTKVIKEETLTENKILTSGHTNNNKRMKYTKTVHKVYNKILKDASTDTSTLSLKSKSKVTVANTVFQQPPIKYTWASAKRASEFIENIIKRIKNGVYFNQELEILKKTNISSRNNWTQTEIEVSNNNLLKDSVPLSIEIQECLDSVPGFQKNFKDLKIETFNRNQIAIKHSKTNVVVKFDIVASHTPKNNTPSKKRITFKPMLVVENKAKVFKCDKRILNTGLPAELCSILPRMVNNLSDFSKNKISRNNDYSKEFNKNSCDLSRDIYLDHSLLIHKICNNFYKLNGHFLKNVEHDLANAKTPAKEPLQLNTQIVEHFLETVVQKTINVETEIDEHLLENVVHKSSKGKTQFEGHFMENLEYKQTNSNTQLVLNPVIEIHKSDILLDICTNLVMGSCFPKFILSDIMKYIPRKGVIFENIKSKCMAIQLYSIKDKQIVTAYKRFNLLDLLDIFKIKNNNFKITTNSPTNLEFKIRLWDTALYVTVEHINQPFYQIKDKYHDTNCVSTQDNKNNVRKATIKEMKYTHIKSSIKTSSSMKALSRNNYISGKRNNVQKCKRCKSMSAIRDAPHTLLNDVTNLHDFIKVLGSHKMLCTVLDKDSESSILSSLARMKTWITCITPAQALLVLLLVTKKESPNLVRYRLLILHGIAVNRITRVSELNMEIEVIENENFNKLPQFSGMNYLPESLENQDALLEELIWIAKTTASDYQKSFDECSEKYIRSLLEKRRKLNPSYLRVMARYVGLGLLKKSK